MNTPAPTLHIAEGGPTVPPPLPDVLPPEEKTPTPLPEDRKPHVDEPPAPIEHEPVREPGRPIPQRAWLLH